jgi:hypothetical protein
MAIENHCDPRVAPECKPPKDLHSTTRTPQQGGPPLNDGPDCFAAAIADRRTRATHSLRLVTFQKIGVADRRARRSAISARRSARDIGRAGYIT